MLHSNLTAPCNVQKNAAGFGNTETYLPFGKFFHIVQRPAPIGVKLYQFEGASGEGAVCARCGDQFASKMHIEDLKTVLRHLDYDYRMHGPAETWQDLCPACKRKTLGKCPAAVEKIQFRTGGRCLLISNIGPTW